MNVNQIRAYIIECEKGFTDSKDENIKSFCADLISKIDKKRVWGNPKSPAKFNYKGEDLTMLELQSISKFSQATIKQRMNQGLSVEDAVNKPSQSAKGSARTYKYKGQELTMLELVGIRGICNTSIMNRLSCGWSVDEAVDTPIGEHPDGSPINAHQVNVDHNKALKRDEKLLREHRQFARCTARINSK